MYLAFSEFSAGMWLREPSRVEKKESPSRLAFSIWSLAPWIPAKMIAHTSEKTKNEPVKSMFINYGRVVPGVPCGDLGNWGRDHAYILVSQSSLPNPKLPRKNSLLIPHILLKQTRVNAFNSVLFCQAPLEYWFYSKKTLSFPHCFISIWTTSLVTSTSLS